MHASTQPRWVPFPAFSLPEQFRYKRRVYAQNLIDDKQFAKLHTKVRRQPHGFGSAYFVLWSGAQSRGWGLEGWADSRHHGSGIDGLGLGSGWIRPSGPPWLRRMECDGERALVRPWGGGRGEQRTSTTMVTGERGSLRGHQAGHLESGISPVSSGKGLSPVGTGRY